MSIESSATTQSSQAALFASSKTAPVTDNSDPSKPQGGQIVISGRRYVTPEALAAVLGVTTRTLSRWNAARIGPPKIRIGKVILFDQDKIPDWLASRETEPVRSPGRRR